MKELRRPRLRQPGSPDCPIVRQAPASPACPKLRQPASPACPKVRQPASPAGVRVRQPPASPAGPKLRQPASALGLLSSPWSWSLATARRWMASRIRVSRVVFSTLGLGYWWLLFESLKSFRPKKRKIFFTVFSHTQL